jgi:hypothetical protein
VHKKAGFLPPKWQLLWTVRQASCQWLAVKVAVWQGTMTVPGQWHSKQIARQGLLELRFMND